MLWLLSLREASGRAGGALKEMRDRNRPWLNSQNFTPQFSLILDGIPLTLFTMLFNASSPERAS